MIHGPGRGKNGQPAHGWEGKGCGWRTLAQGAEKTPWQGAAGAWLVAGERSGSVEGASTMNVKGLEPHSTDTAHTVLGICRTFWC